MKLLADDEIINAYGDKFATGSPEAVAQAQLDKDKEELSQWVDKPDSEGWWWHLDTINKSISCVYIEDTKQGLKYWGIPCEMISGIKHPLPFIETDLVSSRVGKFCKAYVPEEK
jgi:hypothetical protein